jgi:hypothetical protein
MSHTDERADDPLWAAYRATEFHADTPLGHLLIRVGGEQELVDEVLEQAELDSWVFITASNPGSRELGSAENNSRNRSLRAELDRMSRHVYAGEGRPTVGTWTPEESFLALGVGRDEARELGARFGQNAVVWGRKGGVAELLDCK